MPGRASAPRLAAFGGVAAPVPPASLRSSSAHRSTSASPCGLRPSPASAPRSLPVSAPLRTPQPAPPATCFARMPSAPSAIAAAAPPVLTSPTLRVTLPCRAAARSRAFGRCRSLRAPFTDKTPWSVLRSSTRCLAATSRRAHGSPPSAALPQSCRPPRCARSVQHSPRVLPFSIAIDMCCPRRGPPPPNSGPIRPSSFASPVRASPVAGFRTSPCSVSSPLRTLCPRLRSLSLPPRFVRRHPPASHMPRRLRRHRSTHAVRFATLVVGTPLRIRVNGTGFARHRLPHLVVRTAADATARASGSVLRTPALSSVGTDFHSVAVAAPFRQLPPSIPLRSYHRFSVPDRMARALVFTPHASPMLVTPLVRLARPFGYGRRLWAPCSCWTERMSHRYTPAILSLAMQGYACPTPIHGRYTLVAAENTDRYTTGIRPMVRLNARASVCPRLMHAPEYSSLRRFPRPGTPDRAPHWACP